jgi:hypothetical protein
MTVQYFGARTVNERRRRRLALEATHAEPLSSAFEPRPFTPTRDGEPIPAVERTRVVSRINSLIRPESWKTWVVIALAAILQSAVVWGGALIDRTMPAVSEVFGLAAGRASRFYSMLMLLCVTQLSFIVLWYRTHSRKDFHGRYRVWIWSSLVWPVFFLSSITDVHLTLSRRVGAAIPSLGAAFGERLWIVPAVILFWSTVRVISRDMCRCRVSRWLLRGSAVLAAASLAIEGVPDSIVSRMGLIGNRLLQTGWPMLLAAALLHHARFVIHVTNEVSSARRRPSRWMAIVRAGWDEMWAMLPSHTRLTQHLRARHLAVVARWLALALMAVGRKVLLMTRALRGRMASAAAWKMAGIRHRKSNAVRTKTAKAKPVVEPMPDEEHEVTERSVARKSESVRGQVASAPRNPVPTARSNESSPRSELSRRERRKERVLQSAGR